jgi:hypothetical protein
MDNLTCPVCGDHVEPSGFAHAVNNEPMHHTRACPACGSVLTRTADERSPWLVRVAFRFKRPWSENVQPPYPVQWATVTITEGGRDRDYNVVVNDELQEPPSLARVAALLRGSDNEAVIFDELDDRLEPVAGLGNPAIWLPVERPDEA